MKLYEFFNEGDVFPMNKAAPDQKGMRVGYPPYFSDDEAENAAYEYNNQAQIDQEDGVLITSENGKEYRIFRNEGESQHFEPGEVYLTNDPETNSTEYIDTDGYPDVENLLYHHSKQGYFVPYQEASLGENSAGSSITLYNVKGEKKVFTVDKVSPNGGMIVSGNGLNRSLVNQTLDAVTFNVRDPNYKIQAPGFQMQGKVVRDMSPADLDNAMMAIRNQIKTAPKNQGVYIDLVADFYALKFKKESDLVNSMQQEELDEDWKNVARAGLATAALGMGVAGMDSVAPDDFTPDKAKATKSMDVKRNITKLETSSIEYQKLYKKYVEKFTDEAQNRFDRNSITKKAKLFTDVHWTKKFPSHVDFNEYLVKAYPDKEKAQQDFNIKSSMPNKVGEYGHGKLDDE